MEPTSPPDAELVARTLAGNREAFGVLYDRHAALVRAVVAGVSGDWSAVDDMQQDCFLRAFKKLDRLRDPARFGPWIVGIARRVGRERRRFLRRDRHAFCDTRIEIETNAHVEQRASDRDQLEAVLQRLERLDEQERVAIHAFYLQQQDARQVAESLGLSRSGFYAVVQRALARIAAQLPADDVKERVNR